MKNLAAFYRKFWSRSADGHWVLADNAPTTFWKYLITLPKDTDRDVIYAALGLLANGGNADTPDLPGLLRWFAVRPDAVAKCDAILGGKNPPKNLSTVLRNAYLSELQAAKSNVQVFLQAELDKY